MNTGPVGWKSARRGQRLNNGKSLAVPILRRAEYRERPSPLITPIVKPRGRISPLSKVSGNRRLGYAGTTTRGKPVEGRGALRRVKRSRIGVQGFSWAKKSSSIAWGEGGGGGGMQRSAQRNRIYRSR